MSLSQRAQAVQVLSDPAQLPALLPTEGLSSSSALVEGFLRRERQFLEEGLDKQLSIEDGITRNAA